MAAMPPPTYDKEITYDDEIDLRAIVLALWKALWKARLPIIIVTLVAAVAAFVVSFWFTPRQYQATAYVFIDQPVVEFSKSISATDPALFLPTLPDLKVVVKLSTAPELLESVLKDPAVVAAIGNEEISISDMVTAVDVGTDQLSLQVTDTNPQRAALLANTWAEKVTAMLNATYGLGALAQALDSRGLQYQQNYEQAQAALEEAVSISRVDALSAQLQREQVDLRCVLDNASQNLRVLDDLQFFEQGLNGVSGETSLSLGDGLALTTIRQRSLTSQLCQFESQSQSVPIPSTSIQNASDFTMQIDSASFAGFTVSKALEAITQMRAGLQAQLTRLQSDQSRLEQEIPQLQRDLENANARLTQFTLKRDQSQGLYSNTVQIQQRVTTVLTQSLKVATVSVEAVPEAVSRKTLMNTAVAGMVGLMLSVFGVLAMKWWRNE
jgi:capsular polysaccharide biosynthesis protein